jgi:ComF family protein
MGGEWLREAGRGLLDLLYPPRCVVCKEPGAERFCGVCRAAIMRVDVLSRTSRLDGRACVGAYEGSLREAVLLLKYQDRRGLARELGELMAARLEECCEEWQPDGLVPIPIHRRRQRERGYNQAELLANALSEHCDLRVRPALERVRDTPSQVGLTRAERRSNLEGAFAPVAAVAAGLRPVLIDDVQTSGATLEEAAQTLRSAGAHAVFALTLCWEEGTRRT